MGGDPLAILNLENFESAPNEDRQADEDINLEEPKDYEKRRDTFLKSTMSPRLIKDLNFKTSELILPSR